MAAGWTPGHRFKTAAWQVASLLLTLFWTGALPYHSVNQLQVYTTATASTKIHCSTVPVQAKGSALFQTMIDTHIYNDHERREIHGHKSGQSLEWCLVYLGVQRGRVCNAFKLGSPTPSYRPVLHSRGWAVGEWAKLYCRSHPWCYRLNHHWHHCLNLLPIPLPCCGKTVFHETGPWGQKGWGSLLLRTNGISWAVFPIACQPPVYLEMTVKGLRGFGSGSWLLWASLVAQMVKNLPARQETLVRSLG